MQGEPDRSWHVGSLGLGQRVRLGVAALRDLDLGARRHAPGPRRRLARHARLQHCVAVLTHHSERLTLTSGGRGSKVTPGAAWHGQCFADETFGRRAPAGCGLDLGCLAGKTEAALAQEEPGVARRLTARTCLRHVLQVRRVAVS